MDAQRIFDFLRSVAVNNNREWFQEHKSEYQYAHAQVEQFTAAWIERMVQLDPSLQGLQPKDCIWRIYRDTRFSPDKRPYKEWMGTFIAPHGGKKSQWAGYYLHLQPDQCLFAGGMWCPEPDLLKAVRTSLLDNYDEVEEIMTNPHFRKYFRDFDTDNMLKKVPQGFPADFEHADWLKRKTFTISYPISNETIGRDDFLDCFMDICEAAKPLNDFLNYTFEEM